jgi:hypothetical protein
MEKGSFLVDSFNRIIRRVIEAGLLEKLKHDTETKWRHGHFSDTHLALDAVFETTAVKSDYFVFTMFHLKLDFYFLVLGYLLSIFMFVGELLFARYIKPT